MRKNNAEPIVLLGFGCRLDRIRGSGIVGHHPATGAGGALMGRSHLFTRRELNELDKYEHGTSIAEIARTLGYQEPRVRDLLRRLGTLRTRAGVVIKGSARKAIVTEDDLCSRCEILLKEVPEGSTNGICAWCLEELAMLAEREKRQALADAALVAWEDVPERERAYV